MNVTSALSVSNAHRTQRSLNRPRVTGAGDVSTTKPGYAYVSGIGITVETRRFTEDEFQDVEGEVTSFDYNRTTMLSPVRATLHCPWYQFLAMALNRTVSPSRTSLT